VPAGDLTAGLTQAVEAALSRDEDEGS